ncbi:MAG TPA: glycosyltransferase [Pyrinomonadaceae bacterium]|jgi:GT2 family glycosyltransferase
MRERLRDRLTLAQKLRLKRVVYAPVGWALRAAARAYDFAVALGASAEANGLDLRRAFDVRLRPAAPRAQPFSASDFLFLTRAAAAAGAPLEAPDPARPVNVSVIIPVFNKAEFTFQCLRSLAREMDFRGAEVIVVDNASCDETPELLARFGGLVRVIRNAENRGFVDACNQGAAASSGRFLVFLNNDTVVLPGWLEALVETAERDEAAGAVGSMFLYPDGRTQEAGSIIWSNGETLKYGKGKSADDSRFQFAREVDFCSGASLLVRRELFERLGGFDRRYAPAYYEDTDLCMGVRSLGYKVVYQPRSRLYHYEGATAGADTGAGFRRFQVINRDKFYAKWRDVLARDHRPEDHAAAERAANRRWGCQVAVFDDRVPTPDRDSGSTRMLHILRALSEWCHPVLITTGKRVWPEYERRLWAEGVETASALGLRRLMRERRFRAAVISRPEVAEALLKSVRRADPRVKVVFDTVDLHFVRLAREAELTGDAGLAREAERYRETERRLALASDLTWLVSSADREAFERVAPGAPSAVVTNIHPPQGRGLPFAARAHLLFVGSFHHRPNTDGVAFYAREVLPLVREQLPGVELLVVGDGAPAALAACEAAGVRLLGYVPDIAPLFARCRVFVAPLRFGAGMKGKVGEALSYGLPVVTTTVGAEGMHLRDGEEALIADTAADFAAAVVRLYRDEALWSRLSSNSHAHVERHFSPRVVGRVVNDSIRALLGHAEASPPAPLRAPAGDEYPT